MPITLHPVLASELEEFFACFRPRYIAERMQADGFTQQEAEQFVADQERAILPQGIATPGHHFLWAVADDAGPRIGLIWLFTNPATHQAFLFQIEVFAPSRGRGNGRLLLAAAEAFALNAGARTVVLNVFASNAAAIALYRAAGYQTVSHSMTKQLRQEAVSS